MRAGLMALVLAMAPPAFAQTAEGVPDDEAMLSSRLDHLQPDARGYPIRCKPGDIEFFAGKTMGDVFGDAWPATPQASNVTRAELVQAVAPTWPKGLGQHGAIVVVAALVGPDGRVADAKAICANAAAIAKPAVRAVSRSVYEPARFDGVPGTSVVMRVVRFGLKERPSTPVPVRPGRAVSR